MNKWKRMLEELRRKAEIPVPVIVPIAPLPVDWTGIQTALVKVFQFQHLEEGELILLQEKVQRFVSAKVAPLFCKHYQKQLLPMGMQMFKNAVLKVIKEGKEEDHEKLLYTSLSYVWNHFYTHTLPWLQAILIYLKSGPITIRQLTLTSFRDNVLLSLPLEEAIEKAPPPKGTLAPLRQMSLVIQGVSHTHTTRYQQRRVESITSAFWTNHSL